MLVRTRPLDRLHRAAVNRPPRRDIPIVMQPGRTSSGREQRPAGSSRRAEEVHEGLRKYWQYSSIAPTCIHEAAHVIVANWAGCVPKRVTVIPDDKNLGLARWDHKPKSWRHQVMIYLAGGVAECFSIPKEIGDTPGDSVDHVNAWKVLNEHSDNPALDFDGLRVETARVVHANWTAIEWLASELFLEKELIGFALISAVAKARAKQDGCPSPDAFASLTSPINKLRHHVNHAALRRWTQSMAYRRPRRCVA